MDDIPLFLKGWTDVSNKEITKQDIDTYEKQKEISMSLQKQYFDMYKEFLLYKGQWIALYKIEDVVKYVIDDTEDKVIARIKNIQPPIEGMFVTQIGYAIFSPIIN